MWIIVLWIHVLFKHNWKSRFGKHIFFTNIGIRIYFYIYLHLYQSLAHYFPYGFWMVIISWPWFSNEFLDITPTYQKNDKLDLDFIKIKMKNACSMKHTVK